MIDLSQYTPAIQVRLDSGVYILFDGSEGKTYLCSLLHKLRNRERVDSHTYPNEFKPAELLDNEKRDLVMLDRYDMYFGVGVDEIINFAQKGGVVLVDCKTYNFPAPATTCFIRMSENKLEVL